jgi:plastocyanin
LTTTITIHASMLTRLALGAAMLTVALGATPDPTAQPRRGSTHTVSQKNKQFLPGEITIGVGDSVSFVNDDAVTHNVFSRTEGFGFNLKLQSPGKVHAVPFDKAGTAEVRCAFHPTMKLRVVVR